ncbi:acetyltransferase [Allopusillimonas soli]|uniref:Acetyltransferase n=1 Tax=Allopusillimonas soli TaxID=659016 RepID=A0A853FD85_9BURK|nr:acetyltransferase [Allopusillimonas soli]NYT38033.1 acetyltransferase [Allopusillimonas soli]TEA73923.1 acetyltransferase [Allopusillimonas soli]
MKQLAILGASGHGKVVADTAELAGWERCVFFDDQWPGKVLNGAWPVMGNTESLVRALDRYDGIVVAVGDNAIRKRLIDRLMQCGARMATVIHPHAMVSRHASVGSGTVIFALAVVNCGADLGIGVILNTACSVDHDCILADCVHVSPGARLAGSVTIGEGSWVGIGASLKQGVAVGRRSVIAAGAVVIGDVGDDSCVAGVPARNLGIENA